MSVDAATLVALAAALAGVLAYVAFGRGLAGKRADGLKHFSSVPSPLGLPFLGHGLLLGRSPAATLRRWAEKHGGMYRITVGGQPVAVISDPSLLVEASSLPKPSDGQHAGTHAALSGPSALEAAADVSASAGGSAAASAKAVRTAFDLSCSKEAALGKGGYLEALADAGGALTAALINAGPDKAVDMHDLLERAALDAAVAGAVGLPVGPAVGEAAEDEDSSAFVPKALDPAAIKENRSQPASELLEAIRAARAATPSTSILKKPASPSCPASAAVADLRSKFAGLATRLESRGAPRAADASSGAALVRSGVSGPELAANLSTAVLHGASPVAAAAAWVLSTLAVEPTAADKVTRELMDAGLLCHGDDRAPKRVGAADLERLPFLSACVRETMRLHPTGMPASGLLRQAPSSPSPQAPSVGGVALPAGCLVVLATPVAATSASSFPQPRRFWPEGRWLESALPRGHVYKSIDEKLLPVMAFALKEAPAGPEGAFAPLGLGQARSCPASAIAADAVAVLSGAVLANFRHRLADDVGGMKGVLSSLELAGESGGADAGHCGGTFAASKGLRMVCVPRSSTGFSRNV